MMQGALVILEYLKRVQGYNLEIDYEWAYSAEVRRAITNGDFKVAPDLFVLGNAPAATAIGQKESMPYKPLMFVPSITHKIITSGENTDSEAALGSGEYQFLCEEASTPEFCFDALERHGLVKKKAVGTSHLEPDQATKRLSEGNPDLKMLMFFPHYNVNEILNGCRTLKLPIENNGIQEGVLFAHESLFSDSFRLRSLDIAVRNAWLELRSNPEKLNSLVRELVAEERFIEFLYRFAGIRSLPQGALAISPDLS